MNWPTTVGVMVSAFVTVFVLALAAQTIAGYFKRHRKTE